MPDIERLRRNYVDLMIKSSEPRGKPESVAPDGSFPSVDYTFHNIIGGSMTEHLHRLKDLAIAYRASDDASLEPDIRAALRHWVENKYEFKGWWDIIGVPEHLGDTLILLLGTPLMKDAWWEAAVPLVAHGSYFVNTQHSFITGQNLIWIMFNTIRHGMIIDKPEYVDYAVHTWEKTLLIAPEGKEGIQADYSFFQHGLMPYAGGYGYSFTFDNLRFLELFADTGWSLSERAIGDLFHFLLDMQQHFMRGSYMDYSILGRGISNEGAMRKDDFVHRVRRYAALPGVPRTGEFAEWADRMEGKIPYRPLNRLFWKSEIMVHHTPECHLSVRGCSNRIMGTESGNNSQGLKNYHLADGVTCNLARGDEYLDIMPVWDWRRLPGLTAPQINAPFPQIEWGQGAQGLTEISGGASDGSTGCFAFSYRRDRMAARKFTFFFPEFIDASNGNRYPGGGVYLTAGITGFTYHKRPLMTSAEQCLPGPGDALPPGGVRVSQGNAVRCGDLYYHILEGQAHAQIETQSGSWHSISSDRSDATISMPVFSLWFDHGPDPENDSCAYAIAGGPDAAAPRKWILHNARKVQAVFDGTSKTGGAMFYEPSETLPFPCGASLSVNRPCALVFAEKEDGLHVALGMPDATAGYIILRYAPAQGPARTQTIDLPKEDMVGSSVLAII